MEDIIFCIFMFRMQMVSAIFEFLQTTRGSRKINEIRQIHAAFGMGVPMYCYVNFFAFLLCTMTIALAVSNLLDSGVCTEPTRFETPIPVCQQSPWSLFW